MIANGESDVGITVTDEILDLLVLGERAIFALEERYQILEIRLGLDLVADDDQRAFGAEGIV